MNNKYLSFDTTNMIINDVLNYHGFTKNDIRVISDIILSADIFGAHSHGIQRLKMYHKNLIHKKTVVKYEPKSLYETPVSIILDANRAMGQLSSYNAMKIAIEKAKSMKFGMANVINSSHFGIAGYYAKMAANMKMIGICLSNTPPACVPTNGITAMLGTNPIAICIPAYPYPFYMDFSTSVITVGHIETSIRNNQQLLDGWVIDQLGNSVKDPQTALQNILNGVGGILPLGGDGTANGGHKGYALSIFIEIMCSVIAGGAVFSDINQKGVSHFFCAIDYDVFGNKIEIESRISKFLGTLRNGSCKSVEYPIKTPGTDTYANKIRTRNQGIMIPESTLYDLNEVLNDCGLNLQTYLESDNRVLISLH